VRILIATCVFPPEPVVSAQTSADIAREMTTSEWVVEVIAPYPNRPAGKLYPGYSRRLFRHEHSSAGYDVTRCFALLSGDSDILSRFGENISFGLTSSLAVLRAPLLRDLCEHWPLSPPDFCFWWRNFATYPRHSVQTSILNHSSSGRIATTAGWSGVAGLTENLPVPRYHCHLWTPGDVWEDRALCEPIAKYRIGRATS
jgi:hypothetical protein